MTYTRRKMMARIQWGNNDFARRNQLAGDDLERFKRLLAEERPGAEVEISFLVDEASFNVITSVSHRSDLPEGKYFFEAWFFSMNFDKITLLGGWHDQPVKDSDSTKTKIAIVRTAAAIRELGGNGDTQKPAGKRAKKIQKPPS